MSRTVTMVLEMLADSAEMEESPAEGGLTTEDADGEPSSRASSSSMVAD